MEEYDGYMEEEEEWDREGLLDPAWEKQQKKVSVFRFRLISRDQIKWVLWNMTTPAINITHYSHILKVVT